MLVERHARQLLRFYNTGYPKALTITSKDINHAREIVPQFDPDDQDTTTLYEDRFPLQWLENARSFPAFLRRWRKYYLPTETSPDPSPHPASPVQELQDKRTGKQKQSQQTQSQPDLSDPVFAALRGHIPGPSRVVPTSSGPSSVPTIPAPEIASESSTTPSRANAGTNLKPSASTKPSTTSPSIAPPTEQSTNLLGINYQPRRLLYQSLFSARALNLPATGPSSLQPTDQSPTEPSIFQPFFKQSTLQPSTPANQTSTNTPRPQTPTPSPEQEHNTPDLVRTKEQKNPFNISNPLHPLTAKNATNLLATTIARINTQNRATTAKLITKAFV
ncbi:hypothetical protein V8F20_006343 [Naviculisporaceae sp. PSN 640]